MTPSLFLSGLILICAGGVGALAFDRHGAMASWWAGGCTAIGSLLGFAETLRVLPRGETLGLEGAWAVPGGAFSLTLDPLSAAFLAPLFLLSLLCAVYGTAYLAHEGRHRGLGSHWFFFCGLVASMALVLTAANTLLFLAVWELMSLSSFFLVAFDHRRAEVGRAAWIYLLACHLGGACLLALFLLSGQECGSLRFADFGPLGAVGPGFATLLFLLALAGFGAKAGLFPLHVWLPDAHPAAPTHVSALMSAVMVKTGIYGLLRVLTFLSPPQVWWGMLLGGLGMLGALYGIAMAAMQRDVKRCLAYSTVENVGIIFLAMGLGLFGAARDLPVIALLCFLGALFHIWNHALFKGLMFLGAGCLMHASGTRDMDRMGGLLRRMPITGALLLGGSLAISALPPLNGLVGEWLIYLGLLRAGALAGGLAGLAPLLLVGLLAVVGALAVVVFTRLVGVALLGEPRSPEAAAAHESPTAMTLPMQLLLAGCLGIGLAPQGAGRLLAAPAAALSGTAPGPALELLAPLAVLGRAGLAILLLAALLGWLVVRLQKARPPAAAATWGCGFASVSPRMAYTAEGFAELAQTHLLPGPLRPDVTASLPQGLFPEPARIEQSSRDPLLSRVFLPLFRRAADRAVRLRWLQQGKLQVYLFYVFVACTLLIAWSVLEERGWRGGP